MDRITGLIDLRADGAIGATGSQGLDRPSGADGASGLQGLIE
jgi:hypothetical protein